MTKPSEVTFEQIESFLGQRDNIKRLNFKAGGEPAYMIGGCTYPKSKVMNEFSGVVADAINAGKA